MGKTIGASPFLAATEFLITQFSPARGRWFQSRRDAMFIAKRLLMLPAPAGRNVLRCSVRSKPEQCSWNSRSPSP